MLAFLGSPLKAQRTPGKANAKGFYIRKRSDDLDVNSNARYKFTQANGFKFSGSPYLEIRYAEVF